MNSTKKKNITNKEEAINYAMSVVTTLQICKNDKEEDCRQQMSERYDELITSNEDMCPQEVTGFILSEILGWSFRELGIFNSIAGVILPGVLMESMLRDAVFDEPDNGDPN